MTDNNDAYTVIGYGAVQRGDVVFSGWPDDEITGVIDSMTKLQRTMTVQFTRMSSATFSLLAGIPLRDLPADPMGSGMVTWETRRRRHRRKARR